MNYPGIDFDRAELKQVMLENYADICAFIVQPAFQAAFSEMMALPPTDRPGFVLDVWLEPEELSRRGIAVPDGILVQTSAFGDRRPTLFVVKKLLPEKYHVAWENVNWTFNNYFEEDTVPSDPDSSWRFPLKVAVQNEMLASNVDLQSLPEDPSPFVQDLTDENLVASTLVGR